MEHHELAGLFPDMSNEAFERLKTDIEARGLVNPIITFEDKILDGRNRERACVSLGIPIRTEAFSGTPAEAYAYVMERNTLASRHLTNDEKREVNRRIKVMFGERGHGGDRSKISNDILPPTAAERARSLGVSHVTVARWDADDKKPGPKRKAAAPKVSKAFFAKTPEMSKKIAEAVIDKGLTDTQAQETYGVSSTVVRIAVAHEIGQREARADPVIDPATLSMSAQAKLAAAIRQHQKKLDDSFYAAVGVRVGEVVADVWLPQHQKMINDAKLVLKTRRGIMTKKQYQMIRMCLHPDNAASVEKRAEAFRVFEAIDTVLLFDEAEEARLANIPPLPKTYAEMVARKAAHTAKRAAARAKPSTQENQI